MTHASTRAHTPKYHLHKDAAHKHRHTNVHTHTHAYKHRYKHRHKHVMGRENDEKKKASRKTRSDRYNGGRPEIFAVVHSHR